MKHHHHYIAAAVLFFAAYLMFCPVAANAQTRDITFFGDSLSSGHDSWVEVLGDTHLIQARNHAVAGSTMVGTSIPRQLRCTATDEYRADEVVLRLGSNDALFGTQLADYERALTDHLQLLEGRGCIVYLVLPVLHDGTPASLARTEQFRTTTEEVGQTYPNVILLDMPYTKETTVDGLHPTPEMQWWAAVWFIGTVGLE